MAATEFLILVAWVISAALFGVAFVMLGPKPEDYRRARVFFVVSGLLFGASGVIWGVESSSPLWLRALLVAIVGAVALIGITEGLRLITNREAEQAARHRLRVPPQDRLFLRPQRRANLVATN